MAAENNLVSLTIETANKSINRVPRWVLPSCMISMLCFIIAVVLRYRFIIMTVESVQGMDISPEFIGLFMDKYEGYIAYIIGVCGSASVLSLTPLGAMVQGLIGAWRRQRLCGELITVSTSTTIPLNSSPQVCPQITPAPAKVTETLNEEEKEAKCSFVPAVMPVPAEAVETKKPQTPIDVPVLSVDEKVEAIKPLLVKGFWNHSFWGLGADNSIYFSHALKAMLKRKNNTMVLGHLAWLLWNYNWTAESGWSFKDWINLFFSTMGLTSPKEKSPNKYSPKNKSFNTSFMKVDEDFAFLLHPEEFSNLKTASRPVHKKRQ